MYLPLAEGDVERLQKIFLIKETEYGYLRVREMRDERECDLWQVWCATG
jgi:hypothetical protein